MLDSLLHPERAADRVREKGHAWGLYVLTVIGAVLPGAVMLWATPDGLARLTERVLARVPPEAQDKAIAAAQGALMVVPPVGRAVGLLVVAGIAYALLSAVQRRAPYPVLVGAVSIGAVPLLVGDVARSLAMVLKQSAQAGELSLGWFDPAAGEQHGFVVRALLGADLFVLFSTGVMAVVIGRVSGAKGLPVWAGPLLALLSTMLLRGISG